MVRAWVFPAFGFTKVNPRRLPIWGWLVYAFFLAISSLGCIRSHPQQQVQVPKSSNKLDLVGVNHTVRPGETLWRISQQYGVKVEDLMFSNNLADPSLLKAGQNLFIPGVSQDSHSPGDQLPVASLFTKNEEKKTAIDNHFPLSWPLQGVLYARFGKRGETHHDGIDIAAPEGTLISSAGDGKVIFSGYQKGYGNLVIVQHSPRLLTIYAHNKKNLAREGESIRQGDSVAQVGIANSTSGPHLHFEVRVDALPKDPLRYLPPR
jgi:murein DD-endopeptidase MepM/ murein hydrolase activator NlpD